MSRSENIGLTTVVSILNAHNSNNGRFEKFSNNQCLISSGWCHGPHGQCFDDSSKGNDLKPCDFFLKWGYLLQIPPYNPASIEESFPAGNSPNSGGYVGARREDLKKSVASVNRGRHL